MTQKCVGLPSWQCGVVENESEIFFAFSRTLYERFLLKRGHREARKVNIPRKARVKMPLLPIILEFALLALVGSLRGVHRENVHLKIPPPAPWCFDSRSAELRNWDISNLFNTYDFYLTLMVVFLGILDFHPFQGRRRARCVTNDAASLGEEI